MKIDATDYTVTEAITPEIEMLIANRAFSNTFDEVAKLLDNGFNVEYINFYVNNDIFTESSASTLANDFNNPTYWETAFDYLGVYNGYKFLYSESELAVKQKNFVPVKNIKPSFNWTTFGAKTLEGILTGLVDSQVKNFTSFYGTVQNIFGSFKTPLNIVYGNAADSAIQARITGDVYFRTVLIRDLDNRINGYAYYEWGTTNQARLYHHISIKFPISQRTDTTYNYDVDDNVSSVRTTSTPGFSGSRTYLENVYNRYKNTIGYFPVTESLDVYSIITSMIN